MKTDQKNIGFYLVMVLIFFDYIRPQSDLVFLKPLHIPMLLILLISFLGIKDRLWRFDDIATRSFLCMIIIGIIYVPFAHNNFWAYEMTRALIIYFLCYMGIKSFVNTEEKLDKFLTYWLFIGTFCSIKGIFQGGKIIGSGFLGDENDFALYLCMMLPIAYFKIINKSKLINKLFYIIIVIVLIIGIVKSFSRGGFIALAAVSFFCWLFTPRKLLTSLIFFIIILSAFPFVPQEYKDEMATIEEGASESTAGARLYSWECGFKMFLDYPLFGVGPGNFPWRFAEYEPPEGYQGRRHGGRAAHSLFFTLIPEWGIFGVICFFLMIYGPYKTFKLNRYKFNRLSAQRHHITKLEQFILFRNIIYCSLAGYLFAGIFLSVLYYPHFWIICGFLLALNNTMNQRMVDLEINDQQEKDTYTFDQIIPGRL